LIEIALPLFTLGAVVVIGAALRGAFLAMGLPAAERTTQVVAAGVARMGQEENAAVPAPGQAGSQVRLGPQHRSQQPIILQHQGGYRALAIPIGPKLEMLCDPDCKKPKLSLRILTI
jgi:hypothetical protein